MFKDNAVDGPDEWLVSVRGEDRHTAGWDGFLLRLYRWPCPLVSANAQSSAKRAWLCGSFMERSGDKQKMTEFVYLMARRWRSGNDSHPRHTLKDAPAAARRCWLSRLRPFDAERAGNEPQSAILITVILRGQNDKTKIQPPFALCSVVGNASSHAHAGAPGQIDVYPRVTPKGSDNSAGIA